jgi:hypothetical protein
LPDPENTLRKQNLYSKIIYRWDRDQFHPANILRRPLSHLRWHFIGQRWRSYGLTAKNGPIPTIIRVLIVTISRGTFQSLKECIFAEQERCSFPTGAENKNHDHKFQGDSVHCTHNLGYRHHIHCRLLRASRAGVHEGV